MRNTVIEYLNFSLAIGSVALILWRGESSFTSETSDILNSKLSFVAYQTVIVDFLASYKM